MFEKTSCVYAPWYVVQADDKKMARINAIKHFLSEMDYPDKNEQLLDYAHDSICLYDPVCYERGIIAK